MRITETAIPGLLVLDLDVHGDNRGWFKENWQREKIRALAAERKRADAAEAQIEWMRAALERIATLAGMVARDLTGRVEAGKVAAVKQCADVARAALAKGGSDDR